MIKFKGRSELSLQKEAEDVIEKVERLDLNDRIFFYYFFVKNSFLFHHGFQDSDLLINSSKLSFLSAKDSIKKDLNIIPSNKGEEFIKNFLKDYILKFGGKYASVFGSINHLYANYLLKTKENSLYNECYIFSDNEKQNDSPFDILLDENKNPVEIYEGKFTINSNSIETLKVQIGYIDKITKKLKIKKNTGLFTMDIKKKEKIYKEIDGCVSLHYIISFENYFGIKIL